MERPETQYARSGGVHIAYQVFGDGPMDLVFVPWAINHIELAWEEPRFARALQHLAGFSRLILFDPRGTGLSDRSERLATYEEQMDDLTAVLEAAGSEAPALFASGGAAILIARFAATYPSRVRALILHSPRVARERTRDHPLGLSPEHVDRVRYLADRFDVDALLSLVAPSRVEDARFRDYFRRYIRFALGPGGLAALVDIQAVDMRPALSLIACPTLVLRRMHDQMVDADSLRYVTSQIPGARYVEVPGEDSLLWAGEVDPILDEVEEFLTGARHATIEANRVLATVLFTDIVDSTRRAAELGDRAWRELRDAHHSLVRRELDRFRGREVDTAGDGFLATFDGPARAVRCACAARESVRDIGLELRAGLHTGEVELVEGDVAGIAVHIGQRISALAGPGDVLVSRTVTDLVAGSGLEFEGRGEHELKGVPGRWQLYAVKP